MQLEAKLDQYLVFDEYVCIDDCIIELTSSLVKECSNQVEKAKIIFEYVRDCIKHAADYQINQVSVSASDVLKNGHGICYAKSNLLAAMMRYAKIPTGFCYQRLTLDDDDSHGYCIHALNAVYLNDTWALLDARGNTLGVNAQFSIEKPQLAFLIREQYDEILYPIIYAKPLAYTMEILKDSPSVDYLMHHLPDKI